MLACLIYEAERSAVEVSITALEAQAQSCNTWCDKDRQLVEDLKSGVYLLLTSSYCTGLPAQRIRWSSCSNRLTQPLLRRGNYLTLQYGHRLTDQTLRVRGHNIEGTIFRNTITLSRLGLHRAQSTQEQDISIRLDTLGKGNTKKQRTGASFMVLLNHINVQGVLFLMGHMTVHRLE